MDKYINAKQERIRLTLEEKFIIVNNKNLSHGQLALKLNRSRASIQSFRKRFIKNMSLENRKGTGRPVILGTNYNQRIIGYMEKHPFSNLKDVKRCLGLTVTTRTLSRKLKSLGYSKYKALKKPKLNSKSLQQRKKFCKKYQNWTSEKWKRVIILDECTIINKKNYIEKVWRLRNQSLVPGKYIEVDKFHEGTMKLLGCLTSNGTFDFIPIKKRFTGSYFLQLLQTHFLKEARKLLGRGELYLMMDNLKVHHVEIVKEWLKNNRISLIDYPINSSDLSPVENLFSIWKRRVNMVAPFKTKYRFENTCIMKWNLLEKDLCTKLVLSMPNRIKECLKNNHRITKY